jgi:subtilisin family serine protease
MLFGLWSGTAGAQSFDAETAVSSSTSVADTTAFLPPFKAMDTTYSGSPAFMAAADSNAIVPNQVLVKYKEGTSSAAFPSSATPQVSIQSLETDNRVGAIKLELPAGSNVYQTIKELHTNPDVVYAQPIYTYKLSTPSVPSVVYGNDLQAEQWGIKASHLDPLWEKVPVEKRNQIKIAIVDSGIDLSHPDLKDNLLISEGYNFVNPSASPNDDNGHGTHVAGIAAAITNNVIGIAGVAGGVRIIPIKVTNSNGTGDSRSIGQGIIWAADHGADVINLSLGGGNMDPYLQDAVQYAQKKGAIVVAAAGNESNRSEGIDSPIVFPAAYSGVISVGAIAKPTDDDIKNSNTSTYTYANFSNVGPELKVVAPGVDIYSTVFGGKSDGKYGNKSGTSMSAPFVTGLAAILKAANPALKADQIQTIITTTSTDLGVVGKDNSFGYGLIDGARAFETPRLDLKLGTVTSETYTYMPVTVNANDYNGNLNSTVSGNVLLKVSRYDSATGQWIAVPSLDKVVSLAGGTVFAGLQLQPANLTYSVTAVATDKLYVPSNTVYDGSKALPSSEVNLKSLSINNDQTPLTRLFDASRIFYETADVSYPVASVTVSAAAVSTSAKVTINGQAFATADGTRTINLNEGYNFITITVTAENLTMQSYTVSIYRKYVPSNNYISTFYYESGALLPQFSKDTLNYTLYVDNSVTSLAIGALLENREATMTFDGAAISSGLIVRSTKLYQIGSNPLNITVKAPNGAVRTYTFNIIRLGGPLTSGMLKNVFLSNSVALSPTFNPEIYTYQASVDAYTTYLKISAEPVTSTTSVKLNSVTLPNGTLGDLPLNEGSNTFTLTATAINGESLTYTFIITRAQLSTIPTSGVSSGGGGGGGGGFVTIPTTGETETTATATTTSTITPPVVVKASDELLKSELEASTSTQTTIDAKTSNTGSGVQVVFSASILKLAAEKNKSIFIDTGRQVFELPPGAVPVRDSSAVVTFNVIPSAGSAFLSKKSAQAKDISTVYDFNLSVGNELISIFSNPLKIQWKLDLPQDIQLAKLGAYTYNETKQSWDYVGGKATADGLITFSTNHFSQYVVMEYNKTFADMAAHWAKTEVELLASRSIVTGISDNAFGPEQKLTRAEFAALLVRTLGIKAVSGAGAFQDVKTTDWFHEVVYQAYGAGLIEGLDASSFAPNQLISREQMAVMIMRAYSLGTGKKESDIVITQEVKFTDEDQTGNWARSSIRLANGVGLLTGFPDGSFMPMETASRAQAAVVINRLLDITEK